MEDKTLKRIEGVTFKDMNALERQHIQQWIKNEPTVLGEPLLIIQEEFDNFADTRERTDLLALDKKGNLVVIENKRDESGKDVHWQAIKYASYCATITKDQVIDIFQDYLNNNNNGGEAEKQIEDFLSSDNINYPTNTQRIIMVAREFSKEVLSAAQWLLNNGIDISCVQLKPYKMDEVYLLDSDVILPQRELKEYLISLADKEHDQLKQQKTIDKRYDLLQEFWTEFYKQRGNELKNTSFANTYSWTNRRDNYMSTTTKFASKIYYQFIVTKDKTTAELYIYKDDEDENKRIYDYYLNEHKIEIENGLGDNVNFDRGDNHKYSRISIVTTEFSVFKKDDWTKLFNFFIDSLKKLEETFNKIDISKIEQNKSINTFLEE